MIEWLTDTLFATGALMALVLVLRRPVARWFGPGAAYALWALPMIRLVLPPLALPRGLLPEIDFGVEPLTAIAAGARMAPPVETMGAVTLATEVAPVTVAIPVEPSLLDQVPWTTAALAVWLGGAVLFLVWRTVTYRWMRRDLLDGARLVARSGTVRIVESPAINAPLAFGVHDKVVALPMGFLAEADSETSDFAIAHEMEHHAGNDLLALIAMQPLFALHWFNPIGWIGWRAVRSDQEAACDGRVVAGRSRAERARYGALIASLAGGTRLGLAAPMAGSLSGDKPIIHRLKALTRADVSPARRVLARSLFALAIVAVPATATVSYAAMDEVEHESVAPESEALGRENGAQLPEAPLPPEPPAPQAVAGARSPAPVSAPAAPPAPEPPAVPEWRGATMPAIPPVPPVPPVPPMPPRVAERAQAMAAARESAAEARATAHEAAQEARRQVAAARSQAEWGRRAAADARRQAAEAFARAPKVEQAISADGKRRTISIVRKDGPNGRVEEQRMVIDADCPEDSHRHEVKSEGRTVTVICTDTPTAAREAVVSAMRGARASIVADRSLSAQIRAEITSKFDEKLAEISGKFVGT